MTLPSFCIHFLKTFLHHIFYALDSYFSYNVIKGVIFGSANILGKALRACFKVEGSEMPNPRKQVFSKPTYGPHLRLVFKRSAYSTQIKPKYKKKLEWETLGTTVCAPLGAGLDC